MRIVLSPEEIRYRWQIGDLSFLLRPHQRADYERLWDGIADPAVELFSDLESRRRGKSFKFRAIGSEFCIRVPGANVNIGAPVAKEMRKINRTVMRDVLRTCPADLAPRYDKSDGTFYWPNGSCMYTAGLNNDNADAQRGNNSHLNLLDEPGSIDELKYCVNDVYMPQTDTTGGTTILGGTPPKTPAHDHKELHDACEARGNALVRTIHESDLPPERIAQIAARYRGGVESSTFKREYECQFVVDEDLQIVRDWKREYEREVERCELFPFWRKYTSADLGVRDLHAQLFGYYHFRQGALVIEHEWIANGPTLNTRVIAEQTVNREAELGYSDPSRVCDNNNPLLVNDLRMLHHQQWIGTSKDELVAMVNELNLWVQAGRILVHPRCRNLIGCLRNAIWKDSKDGRWIGRELGRATEFGHFDALMALVYLVRNVVTSNPIPADYGFDPATQRWTHRPEREPLFDRPRRVA